VLPGPEDRYIARLMGSERGGTVPGAAGDPPARRRFLQKAAATGTAAFAIPTIITVDPASAQALTSPPPEPPGSSGGSGTVGSVAPRGTQPAGPSQGFPHTELPRTGAGIDRLVAAGLTATASGAALVLWSADMESRSGAPQPADGEPET
jgi:hypothetical protein